MKKIVLTLLLLALFDLNAYASVQGKIAYAHLTHDLWQIWVMDADGSDNHQVTSSHFDKRDPAWLNNGEQLAFRTNNGEVFLVELDGTNEKEILAKYKNINNPSFNPKTGEIVFARFDPRAKDIGDIWKSDLNGDNSRVLTRDSLGKYQPAVSLQGDKIAFVKGDQNKSSYHIWIMNADGSDPRQLTQGDGFDIHPSFSPDGKMITYSSNKSGKNFEIFSVDVRTLATRQLTSYPGLDMQSCFSSDGKTIVFVSDRSGDQQLWTMNNDGSNLVQLTHMDTESVEPSWSPQPLRSEHQ